MEWDRETKLKLARRIRSLALGIQEEEFRATPDMNFTEIVENTTKRIMGRLEPLGFERANKDWTLLEDYPEKIYLDSQTHLWFETAQCRIVKIRKEHAEKLLVLGIP